MAPLRLAFIGAGSMGQCAHLRNYLAVGGCSAVALAELRPTLAAEVAQRYRIPRVYGDHRALLENEKVDAIIAIQPYQLHGRVVPELLGHGAPVLIEKPLARSVEAAEAIVATAGSDRLFIGYHKRSDPAIAWAMERIAAWRTSKKFGRMKYVRVTMPPGDWAAAGFSQRIETDEPYPKLEFDPPPAGMSDAAAKAYDAFVNYYIHQVNLIRLLAGENYQVTYADPAGVLLAGLSDGGVSVALEMEPYRTTRGWQESALVAFEKAWIRIDLPAPLAMDQAGRVTAFEDGADGAPITITPTLEPVHAMRRQAENFLATVRGQSTVLCRAEEAADDLRVARQYILGR